MKKCIIIHGCTLDSSDDSFNKHWMPWVRDRLIEQGIPTEIPEMPSPRNPEYEKFKGEFEKNNIDEDTILIGHSCGCAFLVRWLGENKIKIAKLILVAPWKISRKGDKFRESFYTYEIDKTIAQRVKKIVMFTSDNEKEDGKKSLKMFQACLGGEVIQIHNKGHYILGHMGTEEFPELLEQVLNS